MPNAAETFNKSLDTNFDTTLDTTFEETLNDALLPQLEHFSGSIGVSFAALDGSAAWHYHQRDVLPVASCMKLFVLGTVLEYIQQGSGSLDAPITSTPADIIGGSGLLLDMQDGTTLSVYNMALLMMVVSDNTATNLLTDYVGGIEVVQAHMNRHGAVQSKINRKMSEDPAVMATGPFAEGTTEEYASYLRAMHRGEILHGEYLALFDTLMQRQHYKNFVPGCLPLAEDFDECWADWAARENEKQMQSATNTDANKTDVSSNGIESAKEKPNAAKVSAQTLQAPILPVKAACKTGWMTGTRCDVGYLTIADKEYAYAVLSGDCADLRPTADNEAVKLLNACGVALYNAVR